MQLFNDVLTAVFHIADHLLCLSYIWFSDNLYLGRWCLRALILDGRTPCLAIGEECVSPNLT